MHVFISLTNAGLRQSSQDLCKSPCLLVRQDNKSLPRCFCPLPANTRGDSANTQKNAKCQSAGLALTIPWKARHNKSSSSSILIPWLVKEVTPHQAAGPVLCVSRPAVWSLIHYAWMFEYDTTEAERQLWSLSACVTQSCISIRTAQPGLQVQRTQISFVQYNTKTWIICRETVTAFLFFLKYY